MLFWFIFSRLIPTLDIRIHLWSPPINPIISICSQPIYACIPRITSTRWLSVHILWLYSTTIQSKLTNKTRYPRISRTMPRNRSSERKTATDRYINVPAAIVSPPLRSKTLPISLLVENCSKGIPFNPAVFSALRKDISTSAEAFFVRTLMRSFSKGINSEQANKIYRGFFFLTSPVVRSIKERSLLVVAGTSLD